MLAPNTATAKKMESANIVLTNTCWEQKLVVGLLARYISLLISLVESLYVYRILCVVTWGRNLLNRASNRLHFCYIGD